MGTRRQRNISELDRRALEIRRLAVKEADLTGLEALALIVSPSAEVLAASRLVASQELRRAR